MNSKEFRSELEKIMPGYSWTVHRPSKFLDVEGAPPPPLAAPPGAAGSVGLPVVHAAMLAAKTSAIPLRTTLFLRMSLFLSL